MASTSQLQPEKGKDRDPVLSTSRRISDPPAVFGSVSILLTLVKVCFPRYATDLWLTPAKNTLANEQGYVSLALFCVQACNNLERGLLEGRQLDELSGTLLEAIEQLPAPPTRYGLRLD